MAATRWGIAGTGKIAADFTAALLLLPATDHKVAAVGGRSLSRTEKFATQFNIPNVYQSYKELAIDPDIDVVYVATIHPTHFELCKMMIEAGKNVLCEKPMTMNMEDTKTILTLAKEKDVFFLEGLWSRFFPVYDKLREELAKKTIGDVKYVSAGFGANIIEKVPRLKQKELGGGATLDLGVYVVQFAQLVFGEYPEKIIASGILTDTEVDEATFMTLHYRGGRVAQLQCHAGVDLSNNAEIIGTKGKIHIKTAGATQGTSSHRELIMLMLDPDVLPSPWAMTSLRRSTEISHFWCPDRLTICGKTEEFPLPTATTPMNFPNSEGLAYEAEAVRQCLLKGEKEAASYSHKHSLWNMSIMSDVLKQVGVKYD